VSVAAQLTTINPNQQHIITALDRHDSKSPDATSSRRYISKATTPSPTMPSARGNNYSTVEVRPDGAPQRSNLAPSSPGSPKAVRFEPSTKAKARALTLTEAWSLYHFETHARQCTHCYNPNDALREGRRLCATGDSLAQDVAEHVYRVEGNIYSRTKENHKLVQVELPSQYTQVPQLLRVREKAARTSHRTVPIIHSYDTTYPVSAHRLTPEARDEYQEATRVIIEPNRSDGKSHRRSKHKSTRYKTVVVEDDLEETARRQTTPTTPTMNERRGSLYYDDIQRQERRQAYRVEVREPEQRERRRERPKSGFWS
jgi:hypothetical protein